MRSRSEQILSKKDTQMANKHMNMINIISHRGIPNQSYSKMALHIPKDSYDQKEG